MAHVQNLPVCLRNPGNADFVEGIQRETVVKRMFQYYQWILVILRKGKASELTNINKLAKLLATIYQGRRYRGIAKGYLHESFTLR